MKLEEPSSAIEDYENMISLDSVVDTEAERRRGRDRQRRVILIG